MEIVAIIGIREILEIQRHKDIEIPKHLKMLFSLFLVFDFNDFFALVSSAKSAYFVRLHRFRAFGAFLQNYFL